MFCTGLNPLKKPRHRNNEWAPVVTKARPYRMHKAFLRGHNPASWPQLGEPPKRVGRADPIGNGRRHLVQS